MEGHLGEKAYFDNRRLVGHLEQGDKEALLPPPHPTAPVFSKFGSAGSWANDSAAPTQSIPCSDLLQCHSDLHKLLTRTVPVSSGDSKLQGSFP